MIQSLYRLFIELTNRKWSSFLLKNFTRSRASKGFVLPFAKAYKINQEEMEYDLQDYGSLHDFFTRRLKPGVRQIAPEQNAVVSPVDAVIEEIGFIEGDNQINVKGKTYSIAEMLGSIEVAEHYQAGVFMVLYLSPSHYHRIHSPITGKVLNRWTLGQHSYPVNRLGLKYGKQTLAKNYRTITEIGYETGQIALVKVGAMFVNSIETTHSHERLQIGEEMAYFTFGSTVVLLFEKGALNVSENVKRLPHPIKVGEKIGELNDNKNKKTSKRTF